MYSYELGVAAVIQRDFDLSGVAISGASAGCFPALLTALDLDIEEHQVSWNLAFLEEVNRNRFGALAKWNSTVRRWTASMLPEEGWVTANSRLHVSLTRVPSWRNLIVSDWTSNADLLDGVMASAFVPLFDAGRLVARFRGQRYVDGSLTDSWPLPHGSDVPSLVIKRDMWRPNQASWLWCWSDPAWAGQLYNWGVDDAEDHLEDIAAVLKPHSV